MLSDLANQLYPPGNQPEIGKMGRHSVPPVMPNPRPLQVEIHDQRAMITVCLPIREGADLHVADRSDPILAGSLAGSSDASEGVRVHLWPSAQVFVGR